MGGPLNWYRTRRSNYEDELSMPSSVKQTIAQPSLYIAATNDFVLRPEMSRGMEKVIPNLTRGEVPGTHWALWRPAAETNAIIKRWFEGVVMGGKSKL